MVGQTSSTHTSVNLSLSQFCILLLSWALLFSASFDTILSYLFWKCSSPAPGGGGRTCRGPRWWARRGWRPERFPFFLLKLPQQILQKRKIFQTFFNFVNSALIDVSIAHNLFHGASGAKAANHHGYWSFLLIHLCRNVSFCYHLCFSWQLRWFGA